MRDARIDLDWADGTYSFRLGWGQLAELQEKTDCGPYFLLNRLHTGEWRVQDIAEIIRLDLIGGDADMKPTKALNLVRAYVEAWPPADNLAVAIAILRAGVIGAPEKSQKKTKVRSEVRQNRRSS